MPRYYIDYCPRSHTKPKYDILTELFGEAVDDIKWAFLWLDEEYLAQSDRVENELIKAKAIQEIEQLKKLIVSEQVDSSSYSVSMPSGCLTVETYTPFFHLKTFLPKSIARFF